MPKDLSRHHISTSMSALYAAIHERMTRREIATGEIRPTAHELAATLERLSIPHSGIALDAGCGGTLSLSIACADHGFDRVEAVDLNPHSLLHAQARRQRSGNQAIHLRRTSILALPYADNRFDFAICSGVAHHTPDPEQAIRELHRVLKPGGLLYISLYSFAGSVSEVFVRVLRRLGGIVGFSSLHRVLGRSQVINNFVLDHMYVPVLWLFKAAEVREILNGDGFTIVDEWPSAMDPFARHGTIGRWLTGDGLIRVWLCRKLDESPEPRHGAVLQSGVLGK